MKTNAPLATGDYAWRRSRFQRHSVTSLSDGTIAINRKGRSFCSGSFITSHAISSTLDFPASPLTTSPRLTTSCFGSRSTRCQLINARQRPASFAEIHVPPVGSRGKIAPTIGKIDNLRRQSRKAVQFFVAIHREIKTLRFWEKRNGAH
jgi:hypothetical protein